MMLKRACFFFYIHSYMWIIYNNVEIYLKQHWHGKWIDFSVLSGGNGVWWEHQDYSSKTSFTGHILSAQALHARYQCFPYIICETFIHTCSLWMWFWGLFFLILATLLQWKNEWHKICSWSFVCKTAVLLMYYFHCSHTQELSVEVFHD